MAKINRVEKCRKEQRCSKCGKTIPVGSPYLYAEPRYRGKIVRCTSCGLQYWETSGSEFVLTCGAIQNNWREDYGVSQDALESIKGDLEELRDTCQDSFDNMPESLQYGPTGEMLQERVDMLDGVIDALDCVTEYDDIREEIEYDVFEDYKSDNELDEELEIEDLTEEQSAEFEQLVESKQNDQFGESVDEALSDLEF